MTQNPWQVESIQAFVYINCPECSFKTKEEGFFQDHAVASHPNCFALFGRSDIVIQEVMIEDQKPEYYIEVKADEVPTKLELASALASIEEPIDENTEIFDETSTLSITDSKTNIVVQINESNSKTHTKVETDKSLENLLNNLADSNPKISKKPKPKPIKKEKASFAQMLDGLDDKTYNCYFCDKVHS